MVHNLANETLAMFADEEQAQRDRDLFVQNVGILAAQTRVGVEKIERIRRGNEELAAITYKGGAVRYINIHADSYTAIVRDVFKYID